MMHCSFIIAVVKKAQTDVHTTWLYYIQLHSASSSYYILGLLHNSTNHVMYVKSLTKNALFAWRQHIMTVSSQCLLSTPVNWFKLGCLCRAKIHRTSQDGIKCNKAKELLTAYSPNI